MWENRALLCSHHVYMCQGTIGSIVGNPRGCLGVPLPKILQDITRYWGDPLTPPYRVNDSAQSLTTLGSYPDVVFGGMRRSILILYCTPFIVEVNNTIASYLGSITIHPRTYDVIRMGRYLPSYRTIRSRCSST